MIRVISLCPISTFRDLHLLKHHFLRQKNHSPLGRNCRPKVPGGHWAEAAMRWKSANIFASLAIGVGHFVGFHRANRIVELGAFPTRINWIMITLPETNTSPLKMDGWNTSFLLGWPIFRGYVSFREFKPAQNWQHLLFLPQSWKWIYWGPASWV